MEHLGISSVQFVINHPAGSLGRQLTITLADVAVPPQHFTALSLNASPVEVIAHITLASSTRGDLGVSLI
jgi:arabinose-5-phosphate isomerase